eukprot:scaffold42206_cov32-Prasinocladus_malaysianus.AAC.1
MPQNENRIIDALRGFESLELVVLRVWSAFTARELQVTGHGRYSVFVSDCRYPVEATVGEDG